ncbi:NAD-dependent epimerase/dehydratase family protein [Actinotalea sp. K2]|uniref:NAD-dependent epimerase/dehydratase family protein n=1 Tax=Actinotalea sp. K2 TaxID=2939438 RepID=UPI0020172861|nr:NAD-dependent epimerase/dehydratase family protein [Actinotalea sp. K2]MCL3859905.1 NAD-dependent epimerase/dehydratase family protein [Actinotalea sp. K2]
MARHVILGKGPIGRTLATHLLDAGHEVVVLSRSGGPPGPARPGLSWAAVDGADAAALTSAAQDADALYNCVNPPYHRWPTDWPPVAEALLVAAERTGAVLVTAGNLYSYGAGTQLMTEASPFRTRETKGLVRATMSTQALRHHHEGRLRSTEVRGSDYLGPGAEAHAHAGPRMLEPLLAGKTVRPIGAADVLHTWTYLPDFARTLAAAATTEAAWGQAWHVPSPEPLTFRELARRFASAAGAPEPRVAPVPMALVRTIGLVQPMMREVAAMGYQFTEPFVMDSTASQVALGLTPTPWPTVVAETLAAFTGASGPAVRTE